MKLLTLVKDLTDSNELSPLHYIKNLSIKDSLIIVQMSNNKTVYNELREWTSIVRFWLLCIISHNSISLNGKYFD